MVRLLSPLCQECSFRQIRENTAHNKTTIYEQKTNDYADHLPSFSCLFISVFALNSFHLWKVILHWSSLHILEAREIFIQERVSVSCRFGLKQVLLYIYSVGRSGTVNWTELCLLKGSISVGTEENHGLWEDCKDAHQLYVHIFQNLLQLRNEIFMLICTIVLLTETLYNRIGNKQRREKLFSLYFVKYWPHTKVFQIKLVDPNEVNMLLCCVSIVRTTNRFRKMSQNWTWIVTLDGRERIFRVDAARGAEPHTKFHWHDTWNATRMRVRRVTAPLRGRHRHYSRNRLKYCLILKRLSWRHPRRTRLVRGMSVSGTVVSCHGCYFSCLLMTCSASTETASRESR
jgi:hypothetical protein